MKKLLILLLALLINTILNAQSVNCTFKQPFFTIHFGTGNVRDINAAEPLHYERVFSSCPTDGHYAYLSSTSDCFRGDWFNLPEDHTPGDRDGNMMVVNASYYGGAFLSTTIGGFKGGTTYQLGVWMMNLCKITDKCPFPLLPDITIQLETLNGKTVAQFHIGELHRQRQLQWKQYRVEFTTPSSASTLKLTMTDRSPGGCGNDFALDDITFRECIKAAPPVTTKPKARIEKQQPLITKQTIKKKTANPVRTQPRLNENDKQPKENIKPIPNVSKERSPTFPLQPPILRSRANPLIKQIETGPGEIRIDLYDNGEIDGDTITVYHNNELVVAHAGLSAKPITFHIMVDGAHPHHELVMVADNLGSIPPNTSLMIVSAGDKRYEVFISSTEQKNAKVAIDLKE